MCGIAGFLQRGTPAHEIAPAVTRMLDTIAHRGPDDQGCWFDAAQGVAIGNRRLAVVELSAAGHQPMESASGRYVIVFNGEIYNHAEVRARLAAEGHTPAGGWRGHSDTDALLVAISAWGLHQALRATIGMYAFALWDRQDGSLTLARDRMGEKPLYFGWQGGAFLFGSELKALRAHPSFAADMNWDVVRSYLEHAYVPGPGTIWRGISKLPPGHTLTLRGIDVERRQVPQSVAYWSLQEAAARAIEKPFTGTYAEAVDALEHIVREAVHLQSMADVPVGAFLSGGIDSSTVVAMMQQVAGAQVTTFSIGMPDESLDESRHAAAVAKALGTNHVAHAIQPQEALALIPRLPAIWDEPFADSSQIPTYFVAKIARERVTVSLSGDGGDELFLGYPQYPMLHRLWGLRGFRHLPWSAGFAGANAVRHFGSSILKRKVRSARTVVDAWRQPDVPALSRYWMNKFQRDPLPLRGPGAAANTPTLRGRTAAETAALADASSYLPDDILVKVDRAAMANSLETRAPLLDHRVVEFALALPLAYKLRGANGKRVLRDVLYRHVPRELVDRPKMGFSIPVGRWLRTDLREWAEDLLAQIPADSQLLDAAKVRAIWADHLEGRERSEQLWPLLMLVAWCKANGVQP